MDQIGFYFSSGNSIYGFWSHRRASAVMYGSGCICVCVSRAFENRSSDNDAFTHHTLDWLDGLAKCFELLLLPNIWLIFIRSICSSLMYPFAALMREENAKWAPNARFGCFLFLSWSRTPVYYFLYLQRYRSSKSSRERMTNHSILYTFEEFIIHALYE